MMFTGTFQSRASSAKLSTVVLQDRENILPKPDRELLFMLYTLYQTGILIKRLT